jgi:hypothetical protein
VDTFVLHPASILAITPDEARALVASLRELFASDGLEFRVPRPDRWYVRVPAGELPVTTPLSEAIGHDVFGRLPRGTGASTGLRDHRDPDALRHASGEPRAAKPSAGRRSTACGSGEAARSRRASPRRTGASTRTSPSRAGLAHLSSSAHAPVPRSLAEVDRGEASRSSYSMAMGRDLGRGLVRQVGGALARFGTIRFVLPSASGHTVVATLNPSARWRIFRRRRAASSPMAELAADD